MPRKGGPGITQSDVLVINKSVLPPSHSLLPCHPPSPCTYPRSRPDRSLPPPQRAHMWLPAGCWTGLMYASCTPRVLQDLADAVGADLGVMEADAARMRGDGPTVLAAVKQGRGVPEIEEHLLAAWRAATGNALGS